MPSNVQQLVQQNAAAKLLRFEFDNIESDTVAFATGSTPSGEIPLFQNNSQKPAEYITNVFPAPQGYVKVIQAMSYLPDILFGTGGREAADQLRWERTSYVSIKKNNKEYLRIPLSALAPHVGARQGTGITWVPKLSPWFRLKYPIVQEGQEQITISFIPCSSMLLATATSVYPNIITTGTTIAHAATFLIAGPKNQP